MEKKNSKKSKILIIIVAVLLTLVVVGLVAYFVMPKQEEQKPVEEVKPEVVEKVEEKETMDPDLKALWESNKAINEDYVGEVIFDSNLINLPFVCPSRDYRSYSFYTNSGKIVTDYETGCEGVSCSGNDVYLRMDWKTMKYELGGSVFMDYRNTTYDQNIIIYGHHYPKSMDKDRILFFTPLEKLMEEENYKDNKYVNLVLKNEVRRYEVAYVYLFHLTGSDYDDLQYFRTNYDVDYLGNEDAGYYQKYIDNMEKAKLYDTGVKLTTDDKTLTLQTCLETSSNAVEIVVCKEITEKK